MFIDESQVSNNVYKGYYLKNRGWNIYKVWITDWFANKKNVIDSILSKIKRNEDI